MSEQPAKSKAYLQVLLMFFIIVATLMLGFFMMPSSQQEHDELLKQLGTTNHGTLLMPVKPIAELPLMDDQGRAWRWQDNKPKWRLLIPSNAVCDGDCAKLLYTTRQVHIRLGKYTLRVERLLVSTAGEFAPDAKASLTSEHPYLKFLHTNAGEFSRWLGDTNSPWQEGQGKVVLIDPQGVAMMAFDTSISGNDMLEDLNHLLKYSAE